MAIKLCAAANLINFFQNSLFLRHIALLGSGTAIAQIANIAATPILAALYDPASFGTMVVYMGIVMIVGTMSCLTYEAAILLPEFDDEALSLMQLCFILMTATSFLVLLGLLLAHVVLGNDDLLSHWSLIVLMPLGVLSLGSLNAGNQWSIRSDRFKNVSIASIIRSICGLVVQVLAGLSGAMAIGLVLGRIAGQCAASAFVLVACRLSVKDVVPRDVVSLKRAAARHFRFPLYKAPQSIITLLSDQMPAFALAAFFGPASAGLYWMADRILTLPSTVVSEATAKVFYRECVKLRQAQESMRTLFLITISFLSLVALLPAIIVYFYAPDVFAILGDEWKLAGYYAQWIILWAFFKFSFSPVMTIYMITDQQSRLLTIDSCAIVCRAIIVCSCFFFSDPLNFVMILCIFESLKILLTVLDISQVLKQFETLPGRPRLITPEATS